MYRLVYSHELHYRHPHFVRIDGDLSALLRTVRSGGWELNSDVRNWLEINYPKAWVFHRGSGEIAFETRCHAFHYIMRWAGLSTAA